MAISIKEKVAVACCCALIAAVLLLAAALVALCLVVLRPRPPRVVAAAVDTRLSAFRVLPPELNLTLAVHVTVHNPSLAPLRYGEVVTAVTYHGAAVGQAAAPAGRVPARSTRTVGVPVGVDAARIIVDSHYVVDAVATGTLPFETATAVAGKAAAALLRPFKVSADLMVECSVTVYPFKRQSSSRCTTSLRVL
ncbi:hypothetical protein E2562_003911 [Oryza meyeriana var. granulata]|uniref:Late embryogenesis abundant protein LEA-2 subgroup domain-containing protein n=1 Tax=Oryza meyeriana var. granulata TaxID=110450 RepID=A0A6G1CZJ0_9ORYZ|nr:hypothetical protein E2562_003911 [Oryza meyeriana var. granulata]